MKKTFNRRAFLQRLGAAALGLAVAEPLIETVSTFLPPKDGWTPQRAFDLQRDYIEPAAKRLADKIDADALKFYEAVSANPQGISIRMVREYDLKGGMPARLDVLYGMGVLRPGATAKIVGLT